jgi:hypothetical protein
MAWISARAPVAGTRSVSMRRIRERIVFFMENLLLKVRV